jgi:hypothetical protein
MNVLYGFAKMTVKNGRPEGPKNRFGCGFRAGKWVGGLARDLLFGPAEIRNGKSEDIKDCLRKEK